MNTIKLSVDSLAKDYLQGKTTIHTLSHISLYVKKGEFVSILGPSGCGKTTLFNIIAGLLKPTSGHITIDGKQDENTLGKSGYMRQKPLLLPWLTVQENVMLGLTLKKIPKDEAVKKTQTLLKRFDLDSFAQSLPPTLSGGMAQKAATLRTILYSTDLLLMDEPFAALDALTRLSMQMWLLDVWKQFASSVLFITHDIREAILLSDRIYVLSQRPAKIVQEMIVPLPRPRKKEHASDPQALKLQQILENRLL